MANAFAATRQGEIKRVYILEPWEKHTLIAGELIAAAAAKGSKNGFLARNGNLVQIVCANGRAVYRISKSEDAKWYTGELIEAEFKPPGFPVGRA